MDNAAPVTKRRRGRPRKTELTQAFIDAANDLDLNLMRGVEADCPIDSSTPEGKLWCSEEFDRRKANVHALVPAKKGQPEFSKEFVREATASDKRIDRSLRSGSQSFFEAVRDLIESAEKGYYLALGFKSFTAYKTVKSEYSRSHIGQGIQVYKALHNRIPLDSLALIPIPSAVLLTRLPESKLTDEVIRAAATMKIHDFKEKEYPKHASLLVDATTGEPETIVPEEFAWITRMRVHQQVADQWKPFMDVARWKAATYLDGADTTGSFSIDEKALLVIMIECLQSSGWQEEYDEFQAKTINASPESDNSETVGENALPQSDNSDLEEPVF